MQDHRLWCCVVRMNLLTSIYNFNRTDQAGFNPGAFQHLTDHIGRCRLSFGSGQSNDRQLLRRISIKRGTDLTHRIPGTLHTDHRHGVWHIYRLFVGITGLEPATSRPPDVCATNCAKSRSLIAIAKVLRFSDTSKYSDDFFIRLLYLSIIIRLQLTFFRHIS